MNDFTSRPFSRIDRIEAPQGAREAVIASIARLERRVHIRRMTAFAAVATASVVGFAGSCAYIWKAVAASGFGQYASLALSDSSVMSSFGKDLGLALVESLPALGLAFALTTALLAVWSLATIASDRRIVRGALGAF